MASKSTATRSPAPKTSPTPPRESRAVVRLIEAGCTAECPHCLERVKFRARYRDQQVICNVYIAGVWNRVEQFHLDCYDEAGQPHGPATGD